MYALRWLHRKFALRDCLKVHPVTVEQCCFLTNVVAATRPLSVHAKRLEKITMASAAPVKTIPKSVNTNTIGKGMRFTDYDCLGFDLDNTVCRYKIGSMIKLEYETLAKFMVEKRGYPANHLMLPIEENLDFMLKGLIVDAENGNLLRIAPDGHILHGSHGTTELSRQELVVYYGPQCRWLATDAFSHDPLHTWNGPFAQKMRTLLDYFDMPAGLVFARAVDSLDEVNGSRTGVYSVWPDLLDAIQDMFQKEHFQLDKGGYFNAMKSNPQNYIHQCTPELIDWFKALRSQNKILFLITGSNVDFASHTASNSMGPNWRELFDIVVCFAKKPGFFTSKRPFVGLSGYEETGPVDNEDLERGGIYTYGNWSGLYEFLKKHSKTDDPKIIYIGDNLVQDVYTPAVHTSCDTVAVCEELQAEGAFGHDRSHSDEPFLVSNVWGSYFCHRDVPRNTIWHDIISKHAKTCIPSLEYVASKSLDHEYFHIELQ